ncbi:type IVB secretion system protein IcmH/DotU [Vibrio rhodolitus]|uniref:type IVB secretion system protein IcmH/DotU n=1 Tax=Vibrio rhodolitus TaxID=2231649 RepID=UPI000E0A4623|nr:type IVB secretion system protein IcmH/DotU [Vibrio rhodolitus]
MNDLLDEVTVPIQVSTADDKDTQTGTVRLSGLNAIKNQARYSLAQRKTDLFDNQILRVSSDLLSLIISVKRIEAPKDMYAFRSAIKGQLTDLKYKVAQLDYPPSVADKTCFLFAVMLDEQILHSEWGEESGWVNQTIVSELFGVKNGGEQFYLVAERALLQPVLLKDLLELIYLMIKLGFRGRYRVEGKELLGVLVQRLEEAIFIESEEGSAQLQNSISRPKPATEKRRSRPQRPIRLSKGIMLFGALVVCSWFGVSYWYSLIIPVNAQAFTNLPAFTENYYRQANVQEKEYVYVSTDEELSKTANGISTFKNNSELKNGWRVQLATLSSQSSAQSFLSENGGMLPNAEVIQQGKFYIVSTYVATSQEARKVLDDAKSAGIDDAFITRAKQ